MNTVKQYFHGVKHTKRLKRMSFLNQTPQNYVHTFEEDLFLKHINKFNMIMRVSKRYWKKLRSFGQNSPKMANVTPHRPNAILGLLFPWRLDHAFYIPEKISLIIIGIVICSFEKDVFLKNFHIVRCHWKKRKKKRTNMLFLTFCVNDLFFSLQNVGSQLHFRFSFSHWICFRLLVI